MADIVPFVPESPSAYWKIRTWELVSRVGRRGDRHSTMRIVFEHVRQNRDKIQVIVFVDRQQDLVDLLPFLEAATEMPAGIRVEAHTLESVPWDAQKPPTRWSHASPETSGDTRLLAGGDDDSNS